MKRRPDYGSEAPMVVKKAAAAAMNEPAEAAMHNHRCPVHGQVMQAPKSFPVTCGNCGRVCVPDTEPV